MDQSEFVPVKQYRYTLAAQFALIQQLTSMVSALTKILHQRGIVTPELWAQSVNEAEMTEQAREVREIVAKLQGNEPIEDILKDFEGPIQ